MQLLDVELLAHDLAEALERARALRPSATTTAARSGWRTLSLACMRADMPSRTVSRATSIASSSAASRAPGLGPVAQVHARLAPSSVVVDLVGQERAERREQLRDRDQAGVQRAERGRIAVPEAPARAPHVPVGEVVDEVGDRVAGARGVEVLQALGDDLHRRGQARQRPAVEVVRRARVRVGPDAVDVRVEHVEAERVPQLQHELAHRLADRVDREQVAVPRLLGGQVVPAERVGAVALDDVPGHDDVAERLGHLAPLLVGDVAEAEHGPVRRAVEQQRRDGDQRVEPAARLVDRLADVVGGEALLEVLARSRTARGAGRTASSPSRTRRR